MKLKEFILPLTEPLGWLWLLVVLWLLRLWWRGRWRESLFPVVLLAALHGIGTSSLPVRLLASLEAPYAAQDLAKLAPADAVVMLGGSAKHSRQGLFGFQLRDTGDRPLTAMELARRGWGRALVLGGGAQGEANEGPTESELLLRWFAAWGLTNTAIFSLGNCRTTREEAEHTRRLMDEQGWQRVILVTSASHMRRSEAVFRKHGVPAEGYACDFVAHSVFDNRVPFTLIPQVERVRMLSLYCHEIIGWWLYRWRGWID